MITIGLTGGIASGKSVVSEILRECGAYIIDTDIISREVTGPDTEGARALAARFPAAFRDGILDRAALKNIVFHNDKALTDLNGITHPLIAAETNRRLKDCGAAVAVVVAPLLYETGMDRLVDVVMNVTADPEVRMERLVKRDNITVELARSIMKNQLSEEARNARADVVLENNGDVKRLRDEVKVLFNQIAERE